MIRILPLSLRGFATLALALASGISQAATIELSPGQIEAMGLGFHAPEPVTQIGGYAYPALTTLPETDQALLSAPVDGLIRQIHVVHGEVRKGQALLEIESAELLAAQQGWLKTLGDLAVARSEYERARELHQAGGLSRKKYLRAENRYTILQRQSQMEAQNLRFMGLTTRQLQALEKERRLVSRITLTAPRDGLLFDLAVVEGARVAAQTPLARIGDIGRIVVDVDLPLSDAKALTLNQKAILQGRPQEGRVAYIARLADPLTQRLTVHVVFDNSDGALRVGELVRLQFISPLTTRQTAWRLPSSSVIEIAGVPNIFIRNGDGLESLPVEVLERDNRFAVVQLPAALDARQTAVVSRGAVYIKAALEGGEE